MGYYKSFCIPVILALIGGSLNVGAAVILVGKRYYLYLLLGVDL